MCLYVLLAFFDFDLGCVRRNRHNAESVPPCMRCPTSSGEVYMVALSIISQDANQMLQLTCRLNIVEDDGVEIVDNKFREVIFSFKINANRKSSLLKLQ